MSERILVAVAWPYANGPLHLGHLAGAYLPADIFARHHRVKGGGGQMGALLPGCGGQGPYGGAVLLFCVGEVKLRLEVEPELGLDPKPVAEAQG